MTTSRGYTETGCAHGDIAMHNVPVDALNLSGMVSVDREMSAVGKCANPDGTQEDQARLR
jgi:hypothetical protein